MHPQADSPVVDERFSRIARLVGSKGLDRLRRAHVAVIGLGAVGSYAVEALARAGIGRLRLVDFDEIRPSNLNRQLFALESTIGRPKTDVARQRVADIHPACQVETLRRFVHEETLDEVLAGPPDVVVDAIDALNPKVALLAGLRTRDIPAISSMGAALRTDPTCIRVGPLSEASHCPLAARLRRRLRRRGVPLDIACVYSVEPRPEPPAAPEDADDNAEPDTCARGRTRQPLGSLPTLTGIFGLTAANAAIRLLLSTAR